MRTRRGAAVPRSIDEHLAAAELCDSVARSLHEFAPRDDAIRLLERDVEHARLAALDAAQAAFHQPQPLLGPRGVAGG